MRPDELERRLRARLDALGPAPRAELLHVLMLPDLERVGAIQSYWRTRATRTFGELLIDSEENLVAHDTPGRPYGAKQESQEDESSRALRRQWTIRSAPTE